MSVTIGRCEVCNKGCLEDCNPMRRCGVCDRRVHLHCLGLEREWEAVEWHDGVHFSVMDCPFCSGRQIHPKDDSFIRGYTNGLWQAGVKRLTLDLIQPLLGFARANLDLQFITQVDEDAAKRLCLQKGAIVLVQAEKSILEILKQRDGQVSVRVLTLALAEMFLESKCFSTGTVRDVNLSECYTIDDDAAAALCKAEDSLFLDGLTTLSDASAASLARCDYFVSMKGLATLSHTAAAGLSKRRNGLSLGVISLSDAAAAALAKCNSDPVFGQLPVLSRGAAGALAMTGRSLEFPRLSELSDNTAKALAETDGSLIIPSVKVVSDTAAAALSTHKWELNLDGLTGLSDTAAAALSPHMGDLHLNGLTWLSDAAATALSTHKGELNLNGLTGLSDAAATALSTHRGELNLGALKTISGAGAIALLRHGGVRTHKFLNAIAALPSALENSIAEGIPKKSECSMKYEIYVPRVWSRAQDEGMFDMGAYCRTAYETVSLVIEAMGRSRAWECSLRESLDSFIDVDEEGYEPEHGYNDLKVFYDEVAERGGDFQLVVDGERGSCIRFLPFQLQTLMSDEEWSAVSSLWHHWLGNAPLDECDRMRWQVSLTWAEFLGLPE